MPHSLVITRYPSSGEYGVDWSGDLRPALERTFPTEAAARQAAARAFPDVQVLAQVRDWIAR